ncbi:MAG: cation diffusion facilitator family transporter [Candidatus Omnitrophota bacterium]
MTKSNSSIHNRVSRTIKSVSTGLIINVFMAAVKIVAGLVGNSYALMADGVESVMDIISSAVVIGGIKIGSIPADRNHPYGHGKAESLAAMIVSLALVLVGVEIAVESVKAINHPRQAPAAFTLIVLVVVVLIKETLFRFISSVSKETNSLSVKTDAWHHRSDAFTSAAAFIGISICLIGGKGYESADAWAALLASAVIAFNGGLLLKNAVAEIMDHSPGPEVEATVRSLAGGVLGVVSVEKCRIRKSGLQLFVDIHIEVDALMPVLEAHAIGHRVEEVLIASPLWITNVLVHIEPAGQIRRE